MASKAFETALLTVILFASTARAQLFVTPPLLADSNAHAVCSVVNVCNKSNPFTLDIYDTTTGTRLATSGACTAGSMRSCTVSAPPVAAPVYCRVTTTGSGIAYGHITLLIVDNATGRVLSATSLRKEG
jgi:hypothetical protein